MAVGAMVGRRASPRIFFGASALIFTASTAATIRSGARFSRFQTKGPPMQKPITTNLSIPK